MTWSKDKNAQIAHLPEYGGSLLILDIKTVSAEHFSPSADRSFATLD
ncbi:hypothetical protein [Thalassotalea marina]|nr:hypothetical protein [Thalassotalea marina]WIW80715.1 hypothetical protein [Vibrio alginolyticus]